MSLRVLVASWFLIAVPLKSETREYRVVGYQIKGDERTDKSWLKSYLGYQLPQYLPRSEVNVIRSRLMTTQVFTDVKVLFERVPNSNDEFLLVILLNEKWSTIPVVRGAYGGGTPLKVFGVYDTHVFGSLWTLGAETRKYGAEPNGYVTWARAPRFHRGYHVLGVEYWREFRLRTLYDGEDEELGRVRSNWNKVRLLALAPSTDVFKNSDPEWKFGLDVQWRSESPNEYRVAEKASSSELPEGIRLSEEPTRQLHFLFRNVYDNITIDQLNYDGLRIIGLGGPLFESQRDTAMKAEVELFYYYLWRYGFNFAFHGLVGQTTTDSVENQYFLGGLDSVRGIPDGAIYGTRAYYSNVELRHLFLKTKYLWFQSAAFVDSGGAGASWHESSKGLRSSAGVGLRFAVPQVYRFIVRFDYAWSLDEPGTHGISAGMNQFFQAYRPL